MRGRKVTTVLAAAIAALAPAATADASTSIGPDRVEVRTPTASATVERRPFRVTFRDARGRVVLQQVPHAAQDTFPVAPTPDPVPLGLDTEKRPALYSPLTFTVGGSRDVQYPGTQYAGNQLAGTEAGVQYAARDVVGARPEGAGVRLDVATSDPSGRRLAVTLMPTTGGALRLSARLTPDGGVATMADSFVAPGDESYRGFGGRHNTLDQRGEDFYNWNQQQNTSSGSLSFVEGAPRTGGDRYLFPNGPHAAFYVQSQFISPGRYGFLLDRDELSRWRLASDRPDAWQVAAAAPALDYVVAPGGSEAAIRRLTAITGRHRVPPRWSVGGMMDRLVRFPPEGPEPYKRAVEDDLRRIERGEIKLEGYRIEGWYQYTPGELRRVIERLHRKGVRALLYYRAFVESEPNGYDDPKAFQEATTRGYVAKTPTGQPYLYLTNYNVPGALIDYTNPEARRWWEGRIRAGLDLGADGFMQDFGEQTQVDMRFANGETGATMHNKYPRIYHQLTRDIVDRYEREHPGRDIFFFVRTGYSGSPGSGAYESANFPGDETTDWSRSSGLASLATDMLNRSIGGLYGYTTDIGGYFDVGPYEKTTKELFIRWAEWAALSPLFRLHGSVGAGTHAPWTYDAATVRIYGNLTDLHLRARPLILKLWREAASTGVPPTRPLWLAYPGDREAARQDQQWLLGPDVLVAPVVKQGAGAREVYFPSGCWEHPETDEVFRGPRSARVAAPLTRLPYFFRCGTNPFAEAAGRQGCLARKAPIGPRNIGRIRVARTRGQLRGGRLRRVQPVRRTSRTYRWCVKRSSGKVVAVFAGKGRRARSQLVVTTARAHGNRRVRPGGRGRSLRAYPRRRRVLPGVYRASPRSTRLIGVRRGRVRFVAVASRGLMRDKRALRRQLRRAALPRG